MMRRAIVVVCLLIVGLAAPALATDRGTAKEAQLMVERAILVYDDEGAANAFAEFNTAQPPFRDRDLYIFVFEQDGLIVAHAGQPDLVGQNLIEMEDPNGVPLVRLMVEQATENGTWVDYMFQDPISGDTVPKSSWVVLHDGYVFGCGIYKP